MCSVCSPAAARRRPTPRPPSQSPKRLIPCPRLLSLPLRRRRSLRIHSRLLRRRRRSAKTPTAEKSLPRRSQLRTSPLLHRCRHGGRGSGWLPPFYRWPASTTRPCLRLSGTPCPRPWRRNWLSRSQNPSPRPSWPPSRRRRSPSRNPPLPRNLPLPPAEER